MATFLEQLAELDRRQIDGGLSEYGYRRAMDRLLTAHAAGAGIEAGSMSYEGHDPTETDQEPASDDGRSEKASPRPRRSKSSATARAGDRSAAKSPALDALILFVVVVAFSELLAQGLGNGLPYHKIGGELVFLPGPGVYVINALQGGGLNNPQIILGALLVPCYLLVPWGAYRSLKKPGGAGQAFAGFSIAFRYIFVAGVIAYVQLALLSDYPIDIEAHLAIPALFGWGILGTVLALAILLRRLVTR